jgi:LPXTG-site transpeptidase (sortase) family protein
MSLARLLRIVEWCLIGVGVALAGWVIWVMAEAEYTSRMPIPPPLTITQTLPEGKSLPGDAGSSATSGTSGTTTGAVAAPSRGAWVARLEAPTVQLKATVLEGSDDRTLDRGAGHIEDTPLPGEPGNIGIAGHRDTNFRPLKRIQVGDPMNLTTRDRIYHYTVTSTTIVGPKDVHVLDPTDEPTLTLVTCYPFEYIGHAPKRFIVQARLESEEPRSP